MSTDEQLQQSMPAGVSLAQMRDNYAAVSALIEQHGCLHCRVQLWADAAEQLGYTVLHSTTPEPSIEMYQQDRLIHELKGPEAARTLAVLGQEGLERNTEQEILKAIFAKGTVLQVLGLVRAEKGDVYKITL